MAAREPRHEAKEIELKLEFAPGDAARILSHPALAEVQEAKTREPISIYYDTPDDALRKAGVFLRVRATGEGYVQTIKTARGDAEVFERNEWEQPVESHEPDLSGAAGTALEPLLTSEVRAALVPRFHTRFRRKTYQLRRDGTAIELAIDQGEVTAGVEASPISEVELELQSGDKRELFNLARDLATCVPLTLAVKSKAERGFELLDGGDHSAEKATAVEITPDMTCADGFRTIARSCLRQIVANTPGVRAGHSDALHQMRVGLRRLRAGLTLFADLVAGPERDHLKGELKWITQELGPARDLDVLVADVLEPLRAGRPNDADLAAIAADFEVQHEAAYVRATGAVGSDRFRKLLLDLAAWIEVGAWADASGDDPITEHATAKLSHLRRRVKKRGEVLRKLAPNKRHKLRIRAKRLRYATEFFAATFPGKAKEARREKSLSALKDLQDALGELNDIATRREIFPGAKGDSDKEPKLLDAAERAYARFAKVKSFWKD